MTVKPALSIAAMLAMVAAPRTTHVASGTAPRTAQVAQRTPPSGLILGRVVDAATGQPLSSAVVRLSAGGPPTGAGILTGEDGRFIFSPIPAGQFTLNAERPGYFDSSYGARRPLGGGVPFVLSDGQRRGDATIQMWPWASIAGTVVDELGHRVPGVPINAVRRLPDGAPSAFGGSAVTDARGEYHIQRLPPGTYVVAASCRSINVAIPASMTLPPAAVSTPAPGSGEPTVIVDAVHRSLLAVTGPVRQVRDARERARPVTYVTSYYGGATDRWQATGLDVALGHQLTSIDFAVILKPSVRVAGAVVGPKGPVRQAMVRLLPTDLDPLEIDTTTPDVVAAITGDDGSFTLPSVPLGNYLLDAYRPMPPPSIGVQPSGVPRLSDSPVTSTDPEGYWSRMSIAVTGRDISDLLVTMRAGVKISGETTLQRPAASADGKPIPPFRVALEHAGDPPVASSGIRLDRPGPFEIAGVRPGWYLLEAVGLPPGWEVSSAVLGGRDITGTPFEIGTNDPGSLILTLGDRPIEVRGDVLDPQGRSALDATIAIFPTDMASWKIAARNARNLQYVRTIDGGYAFRGLAAGEYFVAAVDDSVMGDWPSPDLLRKLTGVATRVRVAAGDRRVINVTLRPAR
jgi:hypothetical protein